MGQGCCGGYSGERYAPTESGIGLYGVSREYSMRPGATRRLDEGHHALDPLAHMHNLYKPKQHMPYTRPEDAQTNALLGSGSERLASPEAKYGSRNARMLYANVSGV